MAKRMTLRDNIGRFQKTATIHITKQLEQIADNLEKDATEIVKDKLLETYKNNVLASYSPRSEAGIEAKEYNEYQKSREAKEGYKRRLHRKKLTYYHTNTFIEAIKVEVQDKTVKIVIDENKTYDDGTPATEVYEYLTKGTNGSEGTYAYQTDDGLTGAKNYPTPRHLFEEHTKEQMKGFLDNFEGNILNDKKYSSRKYTKKRR